MFYCCKQKSSVPTCWIAIKFKFLIVNHFNNEIYNRRWSEELPTSFSKRMIDYSFYIISFNITFCGWKTSIWQLFYCKNNVSGLRGNSMFFLKREGYFFFSLLKIWFILLCISVSLVRLWSIFSFNSSNDFI